VKVAINLNEINDQEEAYLREQPYTGELSFELQMTLPTAAPVLAKDEIIRGTRQHASPFHHSRSINNSWLAVESVDSGHETLNNTGRSKAAGRSRDSWWYDVGNNSCSST
jgi:hypothetical protein